MLFERKSDFLRCANLPHRCVNGTRTSKGRAVSALGLQSSLRCSRESGRERPAGFTRAESVWTKRECRKRRWRQTQDPRLPTLCMQAHGHCPRPRIFFGMGEEGGEPIDVQAQGFRMGRIPDHMATRLPGSPQSTPRRSGVSKRIAHAGPPRFPLRCSCRSAARPP